MPILLDWPYNLESIKLWLHLLGQGCYSLKEQMSHWTNLMVGVPLQTSSKVAHCLTEDM
jgi:hypothetical protein